MGGRKIVLKFKSNKDALEYVDLLTRRIKVGELLVDVKDNTVELRMRGGKEASEIMEAEALRIYGVLKGKGGGSLDLSVLITMAQPPHSVPFDVVTAILNSEGYSSELANMKLKTQAPLDEAINVIKSVASLYAYMARMNISQNAKKIIAAYAHVNHLPLAAAIEELIANGTLKERGGGDSTIITASTSFEDYMNSKNALHK